MTKFLRIDCNRGIPIDGGFRHTIFESSTMNGKKAINKLVSVKFSEILSEDAYIESFKNDPDAFIGGLTDEKDSNTNDDNLGGDRA